MIGRVIVPLNERFSLDRNTGNGTGQPVLFQGWPVFRIDQLNTCATQCFCLLTGLFHTPVIRITPRDHRLVDPSILDPSFTGARLRPTTGGQGNRTGHGSGG